MSFTLAPTDEAGVVDAVLAAAAKVMPQTLLDYLK